MIIELLGLPGSGKTFLRNNIVSQLAEQDKNQAITKYEAVKICLQRKKDGALTALFKKLPYAVWNRIIHKHYCLPELLEFSSCHIQLTAFYHNELKRSRASRQAIRTVLGAFADTCVERQLFDSYGHSEELILMDEGFCHRFFTLYGNLSLPCTQEDISRYVKMLPPVQGAIFVATPESLCLERLKKRSCLPVLLDSDEKAATVLEHGNMLFAKLAEELHSHRIPCAIYDGQSSNFKAIADFCVSVIQK